MLVIGFGAAIPWGLMDGLSVSVVPNERAGIFNTSEIANEALRSRAGSAVLAGGCRCTGWRDKCMVTARPIIPHSG
jgi:hypothetical protein